MCTSQYRKHRKLSGVASAGQPVAGDRPRGQQQLQSFFTPLFLAGNLCMVTGGANLGRIGVITNRERHPGSFDVVHVKDANGNSFATRLSNIFVIGKVRGCVRVGGGESGSLPAHVAVAGNV